MEDGMSIPGAPPWLDLLVKGISIFALLAFGGMTAGKAGRNPYLALLLLYPFPAAALIWLFAFAKWPGEKKE
jgi:hypothetical protein